jgi:hypothetical protein
MEKDMWIAETGGRATTRRADARSAISLGLSLLMAACTSTHDLGSGELNVLGGGLRQAERAPGVYYLEAKSNTAPVPMYAAARSMWAQRASELCAGRKYEELGVQEVEETNPYITPPPPLFGIIHARYVLGVKRGWCICDGATLSAEDRRNLAEGREKGGKP